MKNYIFDAGRNLWHRPGFQGIAYSDGREIEERLFRVVSEVADCSVFSEELRSHIVDWPSEYHFSRLRHCLLRPLDIRPGDTVLELGCGCGAITRYLGELGAGVVAVEGGCRRADIAARRCRELDNVQVIHDDLMSFSCENRFDWVLLIGVLEYAPLFVQGSDEVPVQQYLARASEYLSASGRLVVAIENQLGLKYFNGCGEDHLGKPFFGVQDLYSKRTAVTFGRKELLDIVQQAGLPRVELYYPWPDYKLPAVILHSKALAESEIRISDLLLRCSSRDYLTNRKTIFSEQFVLPVLERNTMLEDMANSFLLVAGNRKKERDEKKIAWIYSCVKRRRDLCTETVFSRHDEQELVVVKRRLDSDGEVAVVEKPLKVIHRCVSDSFHPGRLLSRDVLRKRARARTVQDLAAAFLPWFDRIRQYAGHDAGPSKYLESWVIPGEYIDATPFNCICGQSGEIILFDREWAVEDSIPLGWLLYRAVVWGWFGTLPDRPRVESVTSVYEIVSTVASLRSLSVRPDSLRVWERMEREFQASVSGFSSGGSPPRFLVSEVDTCLFTLEERQHWIETLERDLKEMEGRLEALYASSSWRYTRFMRTAGRHALYLRNLVDKLVGKGHPFHLFSGIGRVVRNEGCQGIQLRLAQLFRGGTGTTPVHLGGTRIEDDDYAEWIRRYDILTPEEEGRIRDRIASYGKSPLLSIVMPVFDPPPDLLTQAVESVRNQLYGNWQLCIADDASTNDAVREVLENFQRKDHRIRVEYRRNNGHISRASNTALSLARGEYIVLMDHDDLLSRHALFMVAEVIRSNPDVRMIYSDEDKIDRGGTRHAPSFKCDWNPDLFLSYNFFSHLGVYHAGTVRKAGGFRVGFEGAQDYDLALRCTDLIRRDQIVHIPHVLYHWRAMEGSTSLSTDEKPYALAAGKKAIEDYLQRNALRAECELKDNSYRVRYQLPHPPPMVSLVLPVLPGGGRYRYCLESLLSRTQYPHFEIVIVDGGGLDPVWFERLAGRTEAVPIRKISIGQAGISAAGCYNLGVEHAHGTVVGLLHDDLLVRSSDWLTELVSQACREEIGAVGARLWYSNDTLQHGGIILGIRGTAGNAHRGTVRGFPGYRRRAELIQNFSAVSAACLVVEKKLFEAAEGLDHTAFAELYYDIDFCLKLRAMGYRTLWTPYAELYHDESGALDMRSARMSRVERLRTQLNLRKRWKEILEHDCAYSPNLTLENEDFSFAWPPRTVRLPLETEQ